MKSQFQAMLSGTFARSAKKIGKTAMFVLPMASSGILLFAGLAGATPRTEPRPQPTPQPTPTAPIYVNPAANANAGAAAYSGAFNLSAQEQNQLANQILHNQVTVSPEQRQQLLNMNNISPELSAVLNSSVSNTLNPTTTSGASNSGFNNGVEIGGNSFWYFQPASAVATEVTPGVFRFQGYSGDFVQCPTEANSTSVSIYIAAFATNHTSDQVSNFCEGVVKYAQNMSYVAGIASFLPALPEGDRGNAANTAVGYLFNQLGIQYRPGASAGGQSAVREERRTIIYVPVPSPNPGPSGDPVGSPF